MSLPAIYWVVALSALIVLSAVLLRGPTRAWRRKRRYRLRVEKSAAFWQNLTVTKSVPDSLRVIATLTTAPDRIHLLEPVLKALTEGQSRPPDEIHLNIPYRFGRTGQEYVLPDFLARFPVKIFRGEDEGPGTKLIPTIRRTPPDADVWFFVVDDDVRHLPEALATLLSFARKGPPAAYGFADNYLFRRWSPPAGDVDILCGFAGFIVHRSFFKDDFESYLAQALSHASCRFHDDVYFSNYLALHGISRFRLATPDVSLDRMEQLGCLLEQGGNVTSLAMGHGTGENTHVRAHRAMEFLRSIGLGAINPSKP